MVTNRFTSFILFLIWIAGIMVLLSTNLFSQTLAPGTKYFEGTGITSHYGTRPAGHHLPATETTTVLNKGKEDCLHEWVEPKPLFTSNMVNAVWTNPDTDKSWELFRICRGCLRHEQIKYFSKWVLNKDEYGELLKKIKQ